MTLRRAIADYMEENGDTIGADCIRWTITKGRSSFDGWRDYYLYADDGRSEIPDDLCYSGDNCADVVSYLFGRLPSPVVTLRRLVWRWSHATPEQRQQFWGWEPS